MSDEQDTILTDLQQTCRELGLSDDGTIVQLRKRIRDAGSGRTQRPTRESRSPRPSGPRQAGGPPSSDGDSPKRTGRKTQDDRLREALTGTYLSAGMMCQAVGAGVMMTRGLGPEDAPPVMRLGLALMDDEAVNACVDSWLEVADQNPKVKRALMKAMEGTAIAGLIASHVAILLRAGLLPGFAPIANAVSNGGVPQG